MSGRKPPLHPSTPARPKCEHARCRWADACVLAAYFPATKKRELHNVMKLFSPSFVIDQLETLPEHRRHDFIKSIVYEANFRAAHPVGGCTAALLSLLRRIRCCKAELEIVNRVLDSRREKSSETSVEEGEEICECCGDS